MADSDNDSGGANNSGSSAAAMSPREQDRLLPIANVSRIMKKALPANAKISKDAKETVQECVSEFISFITGEASDKCQREKRKTINGDDLLWAMTTLGFEDYVEPLKLYLHKFREMEGEKTAGLAPRGPGGGGAAQPDAPPHAEGLYAQYQPSAMMAGQVNHHQHQHHHHHHHNPQQQQQQQQQQHHQYHHSSMFGSGSGNNSTGTRPR